MADDGLPPLPPAYQGYVPVPLSTANIPEPPARFGAYKPVTPSSPYGGPTPGDIVSAFPEFANSMLPAVAASAGGIYGGGLGALLGSIGGSSVKHLLQNASPSTFGSPPADTGDTVLDTTKDAFLNTWPNLIKGIVSIPGALRSGEAARVGINAEGLNTFRSNPELETLPENETAAGIQRGPKGRFVNNGPDFAKGYNEQIRQSQSELTSLVNKGFSPSTKAIDPSEILDELDKNPDSYANIDPIKRDSLKTFLEGVQAQKSLGPSQGDSMLRYAKHRLYFSASELAIPTALGSLSGHTAEGLLGGSLILGADAISRLVQNPEIARIAAKGFTTSMTAPESSFLSRAILWTIRGTEAKLSMPNGKQENVQVKPDGSGFTYPQPNSQ